MRFRLVGSLLAALLVVNLTSTMWLSCVRDPMTGGRMTGGQMICCGTDEHSCQGATETTTQWTRHVDKQRVGSPDEGSAPAEISLTDTTTPAPGGAFSIDWASGVFSLRHHPHAPPYLLNQAFRI